MKQMKGAGGTGPGQGLDGDLPPTPGPKDGGRQGPRKGGIPSAMKGRGGEAFSDPLACPTDMRRPPGPPPRIQSVDDEILHREREINKRIIASYGQSSVWDSLKPLLGIAVVGAIAFSQVNKTDMTNALIYTVMFMMGAGAIYTLLARDTLPPLFSLILKGFFALGVLAVGIWFLAMHTGSFTPKDREGRSTFRAIQEEVRSTK